jgi:ferric-chelate reductase (NADPH)
MKKFLSNLLVKYLVKKAVVLSNEKIGESFQLLTIKLPGKKDWIPGQKIQIKVSDAELRSYTPSLWEKDKKTFQTLIYNHRSGPGAQWSEAVLPQTKVQVVGPRKSLDITEFNRNILFFGDETTYGLAYALVNSKHNFSIKCFFEGSHLDESVTALKHLGLDDQIFYERTTNDSHLKDCLEKMLSIYKDEIIIISGKMSSIRYMENALLDRGISEELIVKKRYWGWKKQNLAV